MAEDNRTIQLQILRTLLKPLVRFALRHSHSIQDFVNAAKVTFVNVAEEEILRATRKINVSRISAMTGLYREEVQKIFKDKELPVEAPVSVLGRVIGQWRHDKRFLTKSGTPRVLSYRGEDSEFHKLCYSVSQALNAGTLIFELTRMGYASKGPQGIKLLKQMIGIDEDARPGFELLARDMESLMVTIEENLLFREVQEISNLHIRTEYDNVSVRALPAIKRWLIQEGKNFHKRCRRFISKFDKDINNSLEALPGGARVVVTSFGQASEPGAQPPQSAENKEKSAGTQTGGK